MAAKTSAPALAPIRSREVVREDLFRLTVTSLDANLFPLANAVLRDPAFWEAPASCKWHHNYDGGLAEHTLEVLEGVLDLANRNPALDRNALVLGALFHDWGKTEAYERRPITEGASDPSKPDECYWTYAKADSLEGHIAIGYARFKAQVRSLDVDTAAHPSLSTVPSMILSHHGRKDWGSPVEPKFSEAWALHLADMASVFVICNRA